MSRVCLVAVILCVVFASGYVDGNIIKSDDVVEQAVVEKDVKQEAVNVDIVKDVPEEVAPKCKKIGEFCMNHSDCCTRSCLGYLKRCVS